MYIYIYGQKFHFAETGQMFTQFKLARKTLTFLLKCAFSNNNNTKIKLSCCLAACILIKFNYSSYLQCILQVHIWRNFVLCPEVRYKHNAHAWRNPNDTWGSRVLQAQGSPCDCSIFLHQKTVLTSCRLAYESLTHNRWVYHNLE